MMNYELWKSDIRLNLQVDPADAKVQRKEDEVGVLVKVYPGEAQPAGWGAKKMVWI